LNSLKKWFSDLRINTFSRIFTLLCKKRLVAF
jgi:hypothetical protein